MLDIRNRKSLKFVNNRLDELRKIAIKTAEEQKEFIELKYPKRSKVKTKWSFKRVLFIFIMIVFYAGIFIIWLKIFMYFHLNFKIWQAVIVIFLGPTLINFVLKRFGLQKNDVTVFLK
jgi:hypothetical protein